MPDVDRSLSDFTADRDEDGSGVIPFGLSAVRNVGEGLVSLIIAERERGGPFVDFWDFCDRVDPAVLNKRTMESLTGRRLDALGHERRACLRVREPSSTGPVPPAAGGRGPVRPFSSGGGDAGTGRRARPHPRPEFDKSQRLAYEKEMLGLYVSDTRSSVQHRLRSLTDGTSPSFGRGRRRRGRGGGPHPGRGLHQPAAQDHEARRPDGRVRPRGLEAAIESWSSKTMLEHGPSSSRTPWCA